MGLWVPSGFDNFGWRFTNDDNRPSVTRGISNSGGAAQNTKTSWFEVVTSAQCARDVFGILLTFCNAASSGVANDILVDIGVDPAGGSSYDVLIPDLLASCAEQYNLIGGGITYYFPLWIKAGSSIAYRAAANIGGGSGSGPNVVVDLFGSPRDVSEIRVGSYVVSAGVNALASNGTTVTSGTTSEGAWTTLTSSLSKPAWYWQVGMGCNDSTMAALVYSVDLAIGSSTSVNKLVIDGQKVMATASEGLSKPLYGPNCEYDAPAGSGVYGRIQCSGTADANLSLAAYGVGG